MAMASSRSFFGACNCFSTYLARPWMALDDISHTSWSLLLWAINRSKVAATLEEVDEGKWLFALRYSTVSMDYFNISLNMVSV
ncbi:hypothetical protein [Desulfosporosinus sp. OT]|uniref:hypothetical protein n=1 Tax=Desulfosporosinus sp. OT TaxID=913865 RepID=UPI001300C3C4|nr:hypothetical protein [Desulfosporosinus sp. OT]